MRVPFGEMSENNLLGFDSHLKFKHDACGINYKAFIVSLFMKENDTYYALNYSNDPLIQRLNF